TAAAGSQGGRLTLGDLIPLGPLSEYGISHPSCVVPRWVEAADCRAAHLVFANLLMRTSLDEGTPADLFG
ncbi:MAG: hypothetical protein VX265_06535, partial [Myxococcota bacterium]|nr:hypothetical protein [Myxococcota bacterium]